MILRICTLVLLFLTKLRFPSSKSIPKIIKDCYGESVLKLVRKLERTDLRCRKAELDLSFLKYCFENSLTPKFLRFQSFESKPEIVRCLQTMSDTLTQRRSF